MLAGCQCKCIKQLVIGYIYRYGYKLQELYSRTVYEHSKKYLSMMKRFILNCNRSVNHLNFEGVAFSWCDNSAGSCYDDSREECYRPLRSGELIDRWRRAGWPGSIVLL